MNERRFIYIVVCPYEETRPLEEKPTLYDCIGRLDCKYIFLYLKNSISHKLLGVSGQVKAHWKGWYRSQFGKMPLRWLKQFFFVTVLYFSMQKVNRTAWLLLCLHCLAYQL